jgi:hypothetical protein
MTNSHQSRILAMRSRAGRFLALFRLFGMPAALIPALLMLVLAGGATASAQVVTSGADSGPGTLRSAITNAASGAVITFDPGLSGATITLSNTLTINTNLTIDASALPGGLQINGNHAVQIFDVASSTITVFLNSLTITNGFSSSVGGGIYNAGTLTLTNCTLSGNSATNGGAIYNTFYAMLALNQCALSGNSALYGGVGVIKDIGGGGILNYGTLTLDQCTLSANSAIIGGGGIGNVNGTLVLNQCTLSGNSATSGGGILNFTSRTLNGTATATITNTIVGGNSGSYGADINNGADSYYYATLTYGGANLVQTIYTYEGTSTITGPAPLTNAPDLAPLGNYGGPTQTMPPLPGSPAIGAGSVAANTFSTDQRGYPRTQNGLIDIGAVEMQSPAANPPVLANITVPAGGGNGLQFTFTSASIADFTVLTATNVSLALTNWTVLGEVQQVAPGQYQFTDPQAATNTARFYRVRSP